MTDKIIKNEEINNNSETKEVFKSVLQMQEFSGPLPHPSLLKEYQELIPDSPERFLQMVEEEGKHRRETETKNIKYRSELEIKAISEKISYDKRGQWMAFILAVSIISIGAISIFNGDTIPGSITLGISAVGLAGVFIKGKNPVSKENNKK